MSLMREAVDSVAANGHCDSGVVALIADQALVGFRLEVDAETGEVEPLDRAKFVAAGDEVAFDSIEGLVLTHTVCFCSIHRVAVESLQSS